MAKIALPKLCAWCGLQESKRKLEVRKIKGGGANYVQWGIMNLPICGDCFKRENLRKWLRVGLGLIGAIIALIIAVPKVLNQDMISEINSLLAIIAAGFLGFYLVFEFISPRVFPAQDPMQYIEDKIWFRNKNFHEQFKILHPDMATTPEEVRAQAGVNLEAIKERSRVAVIERDDLKNLLDQGAISKEEYNLRLIEINKKELHINS